MKAPPIGEDAEFDKAALLVWGAVIENGNPNNITEEVARDSLYSKLVEFGGYKLGQPLIFAAQEGDTE